MCGIEKDATRVVDEMLCNENKWSEWFDFNAETISAIPQTAGVYMMHISMKILFIGGSENMKTSIQHNTNPCISQATRIRYMQTPSFEKIADELIKDYQSRHEGNLPQCME